MDAKDDAPETIDAYIASFPPEIRAILKKVRATVRKAAPRAEERISYKMPAFFQEGVVVYFAAFKKHIGLFPPVRDAALRKEAKPYAGPKGNLKFPLDEPIPYALIGRIVKAQARERAEAARPRKRGTAG